MWSSERRRFDTRPDVVDHRDWPYRPPLIPLGPRVDAREANWWSFGRVRDQGEEPSCTGHALAAIVDHLRARDLGVAATEPWASATMLYQIARHHDEWLGEDYGGSSVRGALKGFHYNGVCSLEAEMAALADLPARGVPTEWRMTRALLDSARTTQLGAYYRVEPRLADLHAAVNEAGLVLASARLHKGWFEPRRGVIPHDAGLPPLGHHAFVIVGYDAEGLLVQNSWGREWGDDGVARWSYHDWSANVSDTWVLQLAPLLGRDEPTRKRRVPRVAAKMRGTVRQPSAPSRLDVLGHLVPFREGELDRNGKYHLTAATLRETFEIVRHRRVDDGEPRYRHLLVHFLGLRCDEDVMAAQVRDRSRELRRQGIYPLFVSFDTEVVQELHGFVRRVIREANDSAGEAASDAKDRLVEGRIGTVGRRWLGLVLASMRRAFSPGGAGCEVLEDLSEILGHRLGECCDEAPLELHVAAHGFGAVAAAAFFEHLQTATAPPPVRSLTMVAPLLEAAAFRSAIVPALGPRRRSRRREDRLRVRGLTLQVVPDARLGRDPIVPGYRGSWPELWSEAAKASSSDDAGQYLALESFATALSAELRREGLVGELDLLDEGRLADPRHATLDTAEAILGDFARRITRTKQLVS